MATLPPSSDRSGPVISSFADDPDMAELVSLFVEEIPDRIQALTKAFDEGEAVTLKRLAHQLKGAGTGYGFPGISERASVLEGRLISLAAVAEAEAVHQVKPELDRLLDVCRRVRAA